MTAPVRHPFGGTPSDWTFTVDGGGNLVLVSATLEMFNALTAGTQYTDLALDSDGLEPITVVTSSDGTDTFQLGSVETFFGPPGIRKMWADGGAGRILMVATDTADQLDDHEARIEALENVASNNAAILALVMVMNLEDTGTSTYLTRPALAGPRIVGWVGDDTPSVGAGGLVDRDLYFDTAP